MNGAITLSGGPFQNTCVEAAVTVELHANLHFCAGCPMQILRLSSPLFIRHYWGDRSCFLFLR